MIVYNKSCIYIYIDLQINISVDGQIYVQGVKYMHIKIKNYSGKSINILKIRYRQEGGYNMYRWVEKTVR